MKKYDVKCPYCGAPARLKPANFLYGKRPEYTGKHYPEIYEGKRFLLKTKYFPKNPSGIVKCCNFAYDVTEK